MDSTKYIGMEVHKEAISVAVLNSSGKLVMQCILETKASTILQFVQGPRGDLHLTFEEGTWAAWLYDLLKPQVTKIVVCNPRRNALLKEGNKSDRIDARKLVRDTLSRGDFLAKVHTYQLYFNVARPNSHKENQTRWQIIERLAPRSPLELCLLPPLFLDYYTNDEGGYDLPFHPYSGNSLQSRCRRYLLLLGKHDRNPAN